VAGHLDYIEMLADLSNQEFPIKPFVLIACNKMHSAT